MSRQPVFEYHSQNVIVNLELPNGGSQTIEIESGYAFGTGSHFTTRLCLKMIEDIFKSKTFNNVLDVGCGSGILAISAIALGAASATAIDIEASVIGEAKKNVDINGFSPRIEVHNTTIDSIDETYDLVIANILTDQIIGISDKLVLSLNKDGFLILSGIRAEEKQIVIDEFLGLRTKLKKILTEDDWCSLLFFKD